MVPLMHAQIEELNLKYPCRQQQIQQLSCLLSPLIPSPPSLIVHGTEATCKTSLVKHTLESSGLLHAVIPCKECITGRHLLERTISACLDALEAASGQTIDRSRYIRTENLSALTVHLQTLLVGTEKFVLVFDGIDEQREAPHTLLPALARLSEIIPNLVVVFIVSFARQRMLHTSGTPHIHFPSYTRSEAIQILSLTPPPIYTTDLPADYNPTQHAENANWLWPRFCAAIWDSLAKNTARDVLSFRSLADKLWPDFTASIVEGVHQPREFSKILVARRALFQNEDILIERVVPKANTSITNDARISRPSHDLPYYSKYLLCAAYLASHNPPRTDILHFSRFASTKRKRTRNPSTLTSKSRATSTLTSTTNTTFTNPSTSRNRNISRRLLAAAPFPLERLLAIFHAIVPNKAPSTADVYMQVATLTGLRLLVRGGTTAGDAVDAGARWRVNVGWEYALTVGRSVGFEMEEFVAE